MSSTVVKTALVYSGSALPTLSFRHVGFFFVCFFIFISLHLNVMDSGLNEYHGQFNAKVMTAILIG